MSLQGSLHRWAVHDTTSVQADQDLYADFGLDSGELPSRQASLSGTRPAAVASEALEVPVASIAAFKAPAEAPSSAHDGTIKEERPVAPVAPLDSGLSAEGALQAIANALQLEESRRAPAHIAAAAQVQIQQADSAKHLLEEERKKQVAHEVQVLVRCTACTSLAGRVLCRLQTAVLWARRFAPIFAHCFT